MTDVAPSSSLALLLCRLHTYVLHTHMLPHAPPSYSHLSS